MGFSQGNKVAISGVFQSPQKISVNRPGGFVPPNWEEAQKKEGKKAGKEEEEKTF